ncbi:MAG: polysaccharide deacetylase family protein [Limnohabitans sp.]
MPHAARAAFVAGLQTDTQTGRQPRLMTWDELRACQQAGVTFGSHGMWHAHLPTIQDDALLDDEITGSRKRISEELDKAPDSFCFPRGFAVADAWLWFATAAIDLHCCARIR